MIETTDQQSTTERLRGLTSLTSGRTVARTVYLGAAALLVAGGIVQVFLAGLGVFDSASTFDVHRSFGYALEILPIIMLIGAVAGRMGRWYTGGAVLLFVQFMLQSVFVVVRTSLPAVAALHPVNGFLILVLAGILGRAAWHDRFPMRA